MTRVAAVAKDESIDLKSSSYQHLHRKDNIRKTTIRQPAGEDQ